MNNTQQTAKKIAEWVRWLKVAIHSEVIIDDAFTRRLEDIENYIITGGGDLIGSYGCSTTLRGQFDELLRCYQAVVRRYKLPDMSFLTD